MHWGFSKEETSFFLCNSSLKKQKYYSEKDIQYSTCLAERRDEWWEGFPVAVSKQPKIADGFGDPSSRPPNKASPSDSQAFTSMHWRVQIRSPTGSPTWKGDTLSAAFTFLCAHPCFQVLACDVDERQLIHLQRNWLMDWIKRSPLCPQLGPAYQFCILSPGFLLPSSLDTLTIHAGAHGEKEGGKERWEVTD